MFNLKFLFNDLTMPIETMENKIILNGLYLDRLGMQSGVYFMGIALMRELLRLDERYILFSTSEFDWAKDRNITCSFEFSGKSRFIIESIARQRFSKNIWINFDYFLPYVLTSSKRRDVVVVHDLLPLDLKKSVSRPKKIWYKHQLTRTLKYASNVVAISEFTKARMLHHFPSREIDVIENPVDVGRLGNLDVSQLPKDLPEKFLLTIANPWPHKNLQTLIDAMKIVFSETKIPLIICGPKHRLESQNYKTGSVLHLGFVSNELLGLLVKKSVAYLAPSKYEGFGLTVYENLLLGKLVLASDLEAYPKCKNLLTIDKDSSSGEWAGMIIETVKKFREIEPINYPHLAPKNVAIAYDRLIKKNFFDA